MNKGILTGFKYFWIHFCVEMVCFTVLLHFYPTGIAAIVSLVYDFVAFLPQGPLGELMTRFKKVPFETIGVALMGLGVLISIAGAFSLHLCGIVLLGLGNAIIHACGAVATVAVCEGKIFPSALFVGGGSFGLVLGQVMGIYGVSFWWLLIPLILMEVLLLFSCEWKKTELYPEFAIVNLKEETSAKKANFKNKGYTLTAIIIIAFFVTAVRSFLGYAIPISWKKEIWQSILLFFVMGFGKAIGGFLVDRFGARRVGILSTLLAIPFLIVGNHNMVISVIGVCFFSMTMCITFAMLLSVLPQNPGLAFGVTTIGLAIGLLPVFFYRFGETTNCILVIVLSVLCAVLLGTACNNHRTEKTEDRNKDESKVKC